MRRPATTGVICQGSLPVYGAEPPPAMVCRSARKGLLRGPSDDVAATAEAPSEALRRTVTKRFPGQAMLHVRVGEDVHANLARARETMETLQQGRRPKPHFAVGFAEVGQMLAVFTPKRWELIAKLREIGPVTTAQLARTLERLQERAHRCRGLVGMACRSARRG